ncbi:MAG: hypothetical protein JXR25_05465 [Pontiellaceae bacterium]|nr:hypothetical protein [Pontiellaceae bacterium]MBN2784254.1 hypothetical protein [Pontiellaceae bacterium]
MLTIKPSRFVAIRTFFLAGLIMLGIAGSAKAQSGNEPTATEIRAQAMSFLQDKQYDEAIDLMFTYLDLVDKSSMLRVLEIAQDTRYKLAALLIQQNRKEEAIDVLKRYISLRPANHVRKARKMLVVCYFDSEQYVECIPAVTNALYYNEYPDRDPAEIKAKETASKDAFGSHSSSYDRDEEDIEPDLPYSTEELEMLYFTVAESYFELSQVEGTPYEKKKEYLEKCLDPFTYVTERTQNEQRKGYSIMQMINAMIDLQKFDRIIKWVPELYKTPARFDIRVNLALLNAAAALFEAGEYDSALPLYRMILPRDELIAYQEVKLQEMKEEAGLPPRYGDDWTADEALLFGESDPERQMQEEADNFTSGGMLFRQEEEVDEPDDFVVPHAISELQLLLETLRQMAPYETYVGFQMAQLYKNVERPWEAVRFFDQVFENDAGGEIGQRSVYESAAVLMDDLDEREQAETRAFNYLENHKEGTYPRLVTYVLTRYYQRNRLWAGIKGLRSYIEGFERSDDVDITRYDTELNFMLGVADLMTQQYSNAVAQFEYVIDEYSGTAQEANSLFWCGFSYLCLENNEKAYECFERYTRDFSDLKPDESLLDEAYYQGGICLFGMNRLDEAKERFTYVIETFGPSSSVYPDSCNMRGDILGSEGGKMLDAAVEDYKHAFENASKASQATYATFKMCDIYKADEAYYGLSYIREQVNVYLAKWGDRGADIAKALFWLGRLEIQEGHPERAVERYMDAVVDYGTNLRQDGVDSMIPELVKNALIFLNEEERDLIKRRLMIALESTDSEVLKLRLRVVLAKFDQTELELGKTLISELENLNNASPPVLAVICDASFAMEDYSRSEEILRIFKYNFEDSNFMRSAYRLRAFGQFARGNLDGAFQTVVEAQEEYGTDATESWAQLMKADILRRQALLFAGNEPMTEEQLVEASAIQLQIEMDNLESTIEQLDQAKNKKIVDTKAVERLTNLQSVIEEKVAGLERAVAGDSFENATRKLLVRCKIDEAREQNKNVMGVPEWRGKPFAQATYQLGQVEEADGNLLDAHAYYQRVYFQYKGLGEWGAKGYISAANILQKLADEPGISEEQRAIYERAKVDTLGAMLTDKYANTDPLVETAKEMLGPTGVAAIQLIIDSGIETNIVPSLVSEKKSGPDPNNPQPKAPGSIDTEGDA